MIRGNSPSTSTYMISAQSDVPPPAKTPIQAGSQPQLEELANKFNIITLGN